MPDLRARPRQTVLGRVVYDRPTHHFSDKDLVRIFRVRLQDEIDDPAAWLATLLLALLRLSIDMVIRTHPARGFFRAFLDVFFHGLVGLAVRYIDDAYELLASLWALAISVIAGIPTTPDKP